MTTTRDPLADSPALEAEIVDCLATLILARLRKIHGPTDVPPRGYTRGEPAEPVMLTDQESA